MAQKLDQGINLQKPHTGQQRILDAALRFNVLQCGRRFGKTTMGLHILRMAGIMGKTYAWFAPTYKSMSEQWNDIEASFAPLIRKTDKQNREKRGGGMSRVWGLNRETENRRGSGFCARRRLPRSLGIRVNVSATSARSSHSDPPLPSLLCM